MQKQKKILVPRINGVEISNWDASVSFVTDAIDFPESTPWAAQVIDVDVAGGSPQWSVLCSTTLSGNFVPYDESSSDLVITQVGNRMVYDSIFAPRYMKISYNPMGATGTFNVLISK